MNHTFGNSKFYLGTHKPHWLWTPGFTDGLPLFISRVTLSLKVNLKPALGPWALDSGGFSALSKDGKWNITAEEYVAEVRRYRAEIGNMDFAAIMDWMCEPDILEKTGLTVKQHQERTIASYWELVKLAPEIPWMPVIQGWTKEDYLECVEMYRESGLDLSKLPRVGIGSVCRRQDTNEVEDIIKRLSVAGIKLHGFGFKKLGLKRVGEYLASSDSMAWSFCARRDKPLPGCSHASCSNCSKYAVKWYDALQREIPSLARHQLAA